MWRAKIASGAAWMVLFRLLERSLGVVSTVILARLLVPADFGVLAMAMSVIALIELATAFSLDVPLIQKAEPKREHYDTAWTLNLLFTSACALVIAALAYPASRFYSEPRLAPVMLVLSAGWVVQAFENNGTVNFRRSMDFARELRFLLGKKLAGFVVTIALAFWLRSYWSLVAGVVAGRVAGVLLSYTMQPFRPRFDLSARHDLFSISRWLFINNLLHFGTTRLSHFFIGRILGPRALGLYTIGSEFAYLPQTELVAPINRAVFPGYARMVADAAEMRRSFIDVNAVVAAFVFPASVGMAAIAEPLVLAALGRDWMDAVPIVRVLAIAGGITALMSNTYSAYLAIGRPFVITWILLLELVVLATGILTFSKTHGLVGVAYAELTSVLVGTLCSYPILFRTLRVSVLQYAANVWRPLAAAAVMGVAVAGARMRLEALFEGAQVVLLLLLLIVIGVVAYGAALGLLWVVCGRPRGAEATLLSRLGMLRVAPVISRG